MALLYPDVASLLQVNPRWGGFDDCRFELHVLPLARVLDAFRTCWGLDARPPGSMCLDQFLEASGGPNEKVRGMAKDFKLDRPVLVVAFSRDTLNTRWADMYPNPGPERVIIDGNHRLAALALRRAEGHRDAILVGAFICE